jgi:hypothetical protein
MTVDHELTWHVEPDDLHAYRRGQVRGVSADSIEAHLIRCSTCREVLADGAPTGRRDLRWAAITTEIDRPTRWNRSSAWVRLAVGTPQLALAGLSLAAASLVVPLLIGLVDSRAAVTAYLAGAPVAPMLGVLLAYRAAADPAGQLALASPMHTFRVVVMRTTVLLAAVLPAGLLAAVLLPADAALLLGWFLPTLAGCALVLAAGTRFDPLWLACSLAVGWATLVWAGMSDDRVRPVADALRDLQVNGVAVQSTSLVVTLAAVGLLTLRRDQIDYGGVRT